MPFTNVSEAHPGLEHLYWLAQILLAIVALLAALFAYSQVRSSRLFELLKYIQNPEVQKARRIVFDEIEGKDKDSWINDHRLVGAAGVVCASYDILGRILSYSWFGRTFPRYGLAGFYIRHWAPSIVRTYEALRPFLELQRTTNGPNYMSGFDWLFERASELGSQAQQSAS